MKNINKSIWVCCWIFLAMYSPAISQNITAPPWENDPKAFLQNLAVTASKEQIIVQDQIKTTEKNIREINAKLSQTKVASEKALLITNQKSLKKQLSEYQESLKSKIKISQKYKSLLTQSSDQIKDYLFRAFPGEINIQSAKQNTVTPALSNSNAIQDPKLKNETPTPSVSNPSLAAASAPINYKTWIGGGLVNQECKFQINDDATHTRSVVEELLFTYTPDEIKKALRGLSYLKCSAFVGKEPGYTFIQLNIEIASERALQHYGNLDKSFMIAKLINGKEVRLINSRFDSGKSDPVKKMTSISGMFYIDKNDEKTLMSSELDTIRFHYSSGYEDYIIYNVDFFTRQLSCLNSIK